MKVIKVYGSGCKNCTTTAARVLEIAGEMQLEIQMEKVTDLEAMMTAGVVSTPAIAVNDVLVHSGSVPSSEKVRDLLSNIQRSPCPGT